MFIDPVHIAPLVHMAAFIVEPEILLSNVPCSRWHYTFPKICLLGPLLHNPSALQQSILLKSGQYLCLSPPGCRGTKSVCYSIAFWGWDCSG